MSELVLKLVNMSISAGWLVLAVLLFRLLFKKAPKWISCLLWGIVALRLLIPITFESEFSLIPSAEVIPQNITTTQTPAIYSGIPAVNSAVNPLFTQYVMPENHTLEKILSVASVVWLVGVAVLLLYSTVSYGRLRWRVRVSLRMQSNLYACDNIETPFILGILFPRIYIPSGMDAGRLQHVLAHENAHLKRLDHWWKPLGFLLLTVYWFNPLLWIAYILLCRDIEQACDEKVITQMDNAGKRAYSEALLACSVHRRMIMACPVAFGELGVKARIKGILNYRKPSFWILLAAAVACTVTVVCFLTNPVSCRHPYDSVITVPSTCTQKGMQTLTCTKCEHSYTAPVDLLEHTYAPGKVLEAPDCVHAGTMELVCTECGAVKTGVMEMTAHTFGEPFLTKAPNCAETGEMSAQCQVCHGVQVVGTIATNHDHELHETLVVEASCAHHGEGIIACSRCDYEKPCTYAQLAHTYTEKQRFPSTCIYTGVLVLVCTECDVEYNHILPESSEHTWWEDPITKIIRCAYCGAVKSWGPYYPQPSNPFDPYEPKPSPAVPPWPVIKLTP
jgi:beta-lactamase regulating signal transducer with metallopeptidase domain